MAISNVSINPPTNNPVNAIVGNSASPPVNALQPSANKPASATVTLSEQGQKLSQGASPASQTQSKPTQTSNTVNTSAAQNAVPQSKETAAAPGIQFVQGESKGGRVNTFA